MRTLKLLMLLILINIQVSAQKYVWSPCVKNIDTSNGQLTGYFKADTEIGIAKFLDGNLVSKPRVILAGDNILTIKKAVVWDDQESNPDWLPFGWIPGKIGAEFGKGNVWANWHVVIYDIDKTERLWKTCLQGPALSPSGSCEWADEKDFKPQTLTYSSYGIWDWDWSDHTEILVFLYEGDRGFGDDPIGYFKVSRYKTTGQDLSLSDNGYPINPDGHDIDLVFRTETYNLSKIEERAIYNKKKSLWENEVLQEDGYKEQR